jgi:tRNA dimethylallyltransferase
MKKVIVIVGATATGKSYLAVRLARKFGGEVISADSRQVYKGIDTGTGKITKSEMKGVPHHLIDVVDPRRKFSVAEYKKRADREIKKIINRDNIPIICGGTGFYVDAVTTGMILPEVPPNKRLRRELDKKSVEELFQTLKKLDSERAKNIDPHNKVRIIRAIEIAKTLGKVPHLRTSPPQYDFIKIGIKVADETLKRKIRTRLRKRMRGGMAVEIYNLHKKGVPWRRFMELGFDQKYVALYLQKKIGNKEMLDELMKSNWNYAKRQKTWFLRDKEINWFEPSKYLKIVEFVKQNL